MKVSIITVCHNQLYHTKRFIASLKRFTPQEPIEWELIVVDSGCTDGTVDYCHKEIAVSELESYPENIGWIKGINSGIEYVLKNDPQSDIIIFANNDVVLDSPGWLERLCKHFDNPTVGAVGPTSNYVIGRQNIVCNVPHITEEETKTIVGFFFAVRKEIVDRIGPLEENFDKYVPEESEEVRAKLKLGGADDLDYSRRIAEDGWKLVIARDVFVWHAGSRTFMEVVGKEGYDKQWRTADLAYERKWGPGSRAACFDIPTIVCIGIPPRTYHTHWKFTRSLALMQKPPGFWNIIDSPRTIVDQARNLIADLARKNGATHLLFIDDDHVLPSNLYYKLASHNKDVVGALCFKRVEPFSPCLYSWQTSRADGNLMVVSRHDLMFKGLQKVDAVGFGAILIKVSVFEKIPFPWFKFSEVGEDLHFCDLCAQNGIEVHCDTDLVVNHINDSGMEVDQNTFYGFHQDKAKRVSG